MSAMLKIIASPPVMSFRSWSYICGTGQVSLHAEPKGATIVYDLNGQKTEEYEPLGLVVIQDMLNMAEICAENGVLDVVIHSEPKPTRQWPRSTKEVYEQQPFRIEYGEDDYND